jgi:hypothetical protein
MIFTIGFGGEPKANMEDKNDDGGNVPKQVTYLDYTRSNKQEMHRLPRILSIFAAHILTMTILPLLLLVCSCLIFKGCSWTAMYEDRI